MAYIINGGIFAIEIPEENIQKRKGIAMEGIIGRVLPRASAHREQAEDGSEELLALIQQTGKELETVRSRFELETDFEMVEAFILELNSLEKRYDCLIREAKRRHIAGKVRILSA